MSVSRQISVILVYRGWRDSLSARLAIDSLSSENLSNNVTTAISQPILMSFSEQAKLGHKVSPLFVFVSGTNISN